jgi:hypothetical protein
MKNTQFTGAVDRVCEGVAVILTPGGWEFTIPLKNLPPGTAEGSVVVFRAVLDEKAASSRAEKAGSLKDALKGRNR